MKSVKAYCLIGLLSIALLTGACAAPADVPPTPTPSPTPMPSPVPPVEVPDASPFQQITCTEEGSRKIAEQFLRTSPTFAFDGIEESVALVEVLYPDIEYAWGFVFRFESRHPGYGDRSGRVLAQVITPHEAIINVEQGEVVSATIDGRWDMIAQCTIG